MKQSVLDREIRQYRETRRHPDARLFATGELVRFPEAQQGLVAGTVLRVAKVNGAEQTVELRRRNQETIVWKPSESVQVFTPTAGEVRRGTVLEWGRYDPKLKMNSGDLARVMSVDPAQGVTISARKLGEARLSLDPGTWHYAISRDETIGHLRESGPHKLESYRDHDSIPEETSHEESLDRLARPFSLRTHGAPPPLEALSRGDLVYIGESRSDVAENHVFVVAAVAKKRGRVQLVEGRELSAQPRQSPDVWWRPRPDDEIRLYKPAKTIAAQDLLVWKRNDPTLLVKRGEYAEVFEVQGDRVAVSGVTSTPNVLQFDKSLWKASFHRENESYHLTRVEGETRTNALGRELVAGMQLATG